MEAKMNKIEQYKNAKELARVAREFADRVAPDQTHDSSRYIDKLGMRFEITETWAGYYGNSSTHSWGDAITREVKAQIESELRSIIKITTERLEVIAEMRRKEAADEAREVLAEIGEE